MAKTTRIKCPLKVLGKPNINATTSAMLPYPKPTERSKSQTTRGPTSNIHKNNFHNKIHGFISYLGLHMYIYMCVSVLFTCQIKSWSSTEKKKVYAAEFLPLNCHVFSAAAADEKVPLSLSQ